MLDTVERLPVILVQNPGLEEIYPELTREINFVLRDGRNVISAWMVPYPDHTPNILIPIPENRRIVVPGLISGRYAEEQLHQLSQIGFLLRSDTERDTRTPRSNHATVVLFDFEGRGNKPTVINGGVRSEAELLFANYAMGMLAATGMYDSGLVVDPHDKEGLDSFGKPILSVTVLPELLKYFEANIWRNRDYRIVIADDGAIWRSIFASLRLEIPIAARIVKERIDGKPRIKAIYGGERIRGRRSLLVEDMISSGGTSGTDTDALDEFGCVGTDVIAPHIKDVEDGVVFLQQNLGGRKGRRLDSLICGNTTPYAERLRGIPDVHIPNIIPQLAQMVGALVEPTEERMSFLRDHIFPIRSVYASIAALHKLYPELAPDYHPDFENIREEITTEDGFIRHLEELGIW